MRVRIRYGEYEQQTNPFEEELEDPPKPTWAKPEEIEKLLNGKKR